MLDIFYEYYQRLSFHTLDYVVISLNLLIFLFAGFIIRKSPKAASETRAKNRILGLRSINFLLFLIYAFTGIVEIAFEYAIPNLQQISQTGLTILISYVVLHYIQGWIVLRFGKEKEIDGEKIHSESYSSEIIGLLALVLVSSVGFLVIINIWQLNDWLQATSVIGGLLLILFASKDYFLGDMISGLIMHYNHSVEAGAVIRVKEFGIVGVVIQITLSQTIIRDLVQKHEITIPNAKLRNSTIETISSNGKNGCREFIDFKIGYDQSADKVTCFLENVWQNTVEKEMGVNPESPPKITVMENGDHAVTWRIQYYVKSPYRILDARNAMQTVAFTLSQQESLGLNTPVTHQILKGSSDFIAG